MNIKANQYWVRYDGSAVVGPLSQDEFSARVKSGQIVRTNELGENENGPWVPLITRPDLFNIHSKPGILHKDVTKWLGLVLIIAGGFLIASVFTGIATKGGGILGIIMAAIGMMIRLSAPKTA